MFETVALAIQYNQFWLAPLALLLAVAGVIFALYGFFKERQ